MRILVTFAVPEEAAPFRRLRHTNVDVLVTGMGPDAARRAIAAELARHAGYDRVLSCGFCGALDPALRRGEVLVDQDSDPVIQTLARSAGARESRFHGADTVATTAAMKADLRERTGAEAVEMESWAILAVCAERGIRGGTVRVVSDEADEDLPLDFNKTMTRSGGVHFGRLLLEIARHPRVIPELMRLQKNTKSAAHSLAGVLDAIIRGLCEAAR